MTKKLLFAFLFLLVASLGLGNRAVNRSGGGGGHGAGVLPSALAGLTNWWKTPITGETNNVAITNWPDSVGGQTMNPGTAPVYKTNYVNSLSITDWNGAHSLSSSADAGTLPTTMFVMMRWEGSVSSPYTILGSNITGGLQFLMYNSSGVLVVIKENIAGFGASTGTVPASTWTAVVIRVTSSSCDFFINGVNAGSVSHSVAPFPGANFTMGYNGGSSGDKYIGQIGECGVYVGTALSDSDIVQLSYGLMTKYGL